MIYFFLLFSACNHQVSSHETAPTVRTVKFEQFDILAKCVVDKKLFQKMFVQYQDQIQRCFIDAPTKKTNIKATIKDGNVESMTPQPSACLKGVIENWQFDKKCSSELSINIAPIQ